MLVLYCPTCGYNLTGLTEHRCPECGRVFDPSTIERRQAETIRRTKYIVYQVIFMPLLFAWVSPFLSSFFTVWIDYTPVVVGVLLMVLGVAAALSLPAGYGFYLGKRFALARLYRSDDPDRYTRKPIWITALLFAVLECVLMMLYLVCVGVFVAMSFG